MPAGRPTDYNEALADEICYRIASGASISAICAEMNMPSQQSVYKWRNIHPEFAEKIARARDERNEAYSDQIRAIGSRVITDADLDPQRARVAIDAIDKAARLMNPKTRVELTGANGGAIKTESVVDLGKLTDDQLAQLGEIVASAGGDTAGD